MPPPRPAISSAKVHQRVRSEHAGETAEDYVEAIADCIDKHGVARVKDLQERFGVSHVTVSRTVARLKRDGLATTEPYRPIELTTRGRAIAEKSRKRHRLVVAFLEALGVSARIAEADAEGIEHHVSQETLAAMDKHLRARGRTIG